MALAFCTQSLTLCERTPPGSSLELLAGCAAAAATVAVVAAVAVAAIDFFRLSCLPHAHAAASLDVAALAQREVSPGLARLPFPRCCCSRCCYSCRFYYCCPPSNGEFFPANLFDIPTLLLLLLLLQMVMVTTMLMMMATMMMMFMILMVMMTLPLLIMI